MKHKTLLLDELLSKLARLKKSGKKIVYTMGIFDIIHPGIIQHLSSAREQGDILVAGVIKDKDIRRGAGRPVFNAEQRALNVAAIALVDYVCIVDNAEPFESVGRIAPDVFAKGQTYRERDETIHSMLFDELRKLYFAKTEVFETTGKSFSSSQLLQGMMEIFPPETKSFLQKFAKHTPFEKVAERIDSLKDMRVLLIGDGIIDEYHYCNAMNKSAKSPLVVHKYLDHEIFAGGAFIIANHLAGICKDVQLVSLLGRDDSYEEFVRDTLKPNVEPRLFFRDDSPTILKKRYINQYLNQKLFEVNYLNEAYIGEALESEIIRHLKREMKNYDLILVSDFGHGFITERIMRVIERSGTMHAVNTQTNGANAGFNLITKYRRPPFVCLDEPEVRLAAQDRFAPIEEVATRVARQIKAGNLICTLGKKGSFGISASGETNRTPIFSSHVVDTVGAGDAFFAFTGPCVAKGMPLDFVNFIGNAVGALAVEIVGNKKPVEKHELLEFIYSILK